MYVVKDSGSGGVGFAWCKGAMSCATGFTIFDAGTRVLVFLVRFLKRFKSAKL